MEARNKSMIQLFAEKASVDAEIRKIRVKRIYAYVAGQKKSSAKTQLEKTIEILNKELNKIKRCYHVIDELIDELECQLDMGED